MNLHGDSGYARYVRGLTLVELMLSVLLGSVFSLAITQVYLQSKRQGAYDEALARMQENGRFAMHLLRRELGHGGMYGGIFGAGELPRGGVGRDCVTEGNWALDPAVPLEWSDNFDPAVHGAPSSSRGSTWRCIEPGDITPGTDLISIKRTAGSQAVKQGRSVAGVSPRSGRWYLRVLRFGEELDWLYHERGKLPGVTGEDWAPLDYWEYRAQIFYIRRYSQNERDGIPTLCVERLGGGGALGVMSSQCLVEGVEDMQLQLGVDTDFDGVPDRYFASPPLPVAGKVVAARLQLLLRSPGPLPGPATSRTYRLAQATREFHDRYLRRVASTTVALQRNVADTALWLP